MHKSILNSEFLLQQKKFPSLQYNYSKRFFYPFMVVLETSHINRELLLYNKNLETPQLAAAQFFTRSVPPSVSLSLSHIVFTAPKPLLLGHLMCGAEAEEKLWGTLVDAAHCFLYLIKRLARRHVESRFQKFLNSPSVLLAFVSS